MLRFADTHTRLVDTARCAEIREFEARKVDRDFAPIKARAAADLAAMRAANKTHLAWA